MAVSTWRAIAKNIAIQAEQLHQRGHTPSELSEMLRQQITSHPVSI
jgi:hypothetical protein